MKVLHTSQTHFTTPRYLSATIQLNTPNTIGFSVYLVSNLNVKMSTNPLSYKIPSSIGGGNISCMSNSASDHTVIVIFDTNNAITFTGSGVGKILTTHTGATQVPVAISSMPTQVTIIFFAHNHLLRGPMTLLTVKDPVVTDRPWGRSINIKAQESLSHDYDCVMTINMNG